MTQNIVTLVGALRQELEQYGEMLALLDRQQQNVIARLAEEISQGVSLIKAQGTAIQQARGYREECRAVVAKDFQRGENTTFVELIPLLPADYQPLIKALVDENNELLVRVRQRARQNHLMLARSIELMQGLINTLFPSLETRVYNGLGTMTVHGTRTRAVYEAVG